PASSGALDGGIAGAGGGGQVERRRSCPRARRPRPHRLRSLGAAGWPLSGEGGVLSALLYLSPRAGRGRTRSVRVRGPFRIRERPLTRPSPRKRGEGDYTKYFSSTWRYTAVSAIKSATGTRSSV